MLFPFMPVGPFGPVGPGIPILKRQELYQIDKKIYFVVQYDCFRTFFDTSIPIFDCLIAWFQHLISIVFIYSYESLNSPVYVTMW